MNHEIVRNSDGVKIFTEQIMQNLIAVTPGDERAAMLRIANNLRGLYMMGGEIKDVRDAIIRCIYPEKGDPLAGPCDARPQTLARHAANKKAMFAAMYGTGRDRSVDARAEAYAKATSVPPTAVVFATGEEIAAALDRVRPSAVAPYLYLGENLDGQPRVLLWTPSHNARPVVALPPTLMDACRAEEMDEPGYLHRAFPFLSNWIKTETEAE
ncbi:hypothetical protein [uncultured Rhodospira sp.]|uniref:hypothetical protein n=1 Tax=uncultured Rhodospira sp. TaxID=1936189 RepID=UPI002629B238|nr:hypothetical protein [uncultured Rhodospira sp.]